MTTIARTYGSWLLLAVLIAVAVGCADDQIVTPGPGDSPTSPIVVRLVPGQASYGVGERVTAEVLVENAVNVASVAFHLRYNPEALEYVSAEEGAFLGDDGADTVFLFSPANDGELVGGMSRVGNDSGASGAGLLAIFEFTAVDSGDCGFSFTGASIKNPHAQSLPSVWETIPVVVEQ